MDGNQQRMREALENIARYAETARCHTDDVHILSFLGEIEGWARSALSAPARQCDVGTPEEQEKRYKLKREVYHTLTLTNALAWAQTPYAEERKGEGDGK